MLEFEGVFAWENLNIWINSKFKGVMCGSFVFRAYGVNYGLVSLFIISQKLKTSLMGFFATL